MNFNNPYLAGSFQEFWTRWHITLSRWIRDYLFIPLGGNRVAKPRLYVNLLLVMALVGFWHGAAYTFLIWGVIHGLALVMERIGGLRRMTERSAWKGVLWFLVVQFVVLVAWIFFRSRGVEQAFHMAGKIFCFQGGWGSVSHILPALVFTLPVLALHLRGFLKEQYGLPGPRYMEAGAWCAVMLYCIFTLYGDRSEFIYFQF